MKIPKIQLLMQNSANSNNERCIYIRIFIEGRYLRKSTGIWIREQDWDPKRETVRKTRPDHKELNDELGRKKDKIIDGMLLEKENICYDTLTRILGNRNAKERPQEKDDVRTADGNTDFIEYASKVFRTRYESGMICYSTYKNRLCTLTGFSKFMASAQGAGTTRITAISASLISNYMIHINRKHGERNVIYHMSCIRIPVRQAMEDGIMDRTTAQDILLLKTESKVTKYSPDINVRQNQKYLPEDKIRELCELTRKPDGLYRKTTENIDLFLFSFFACGLRASDILTLEWRHVDMEKGTIRKMFLKSKKVPEVDIPIAPRGMEILRKWHHKTGKRKFVFAKLKDDLDITNDGEFYKTLVAQEHLINNSMMTVAKKINVPRLTMHMARHSFAVMSIRKGMNIYLLSKLMGHAGVGVTEKIYAKIINDRSVLEQIPYSEF